MGRLRCRSPLTPRPPTSLELPPNGPPKVMRPGPKESSMKPKEAGPRLIIKTTLDTGTIYSLNSAQDRSRTTLYDSMFSSVCKERRLG